jgi:hypothetical protein
MTFAERLSHNRRKRTGGASAAKGGTMHRTLLMIALGLAASLTVPPARANDDLVLRGMGSFHVGGRIAEVSGKEVKMIQRQPGGPMTKLDPNGQYMVEQMYVQFFIRKGWDTYVSDAVERGRSGFASSDVWADAPIFLTYQDPYERFRIGDGAGSWNADPAKRKPLPGSAFPAEAYENYMKQAVPRWLSTDKAIVAAYIALVDKICPCVLLAHSQGGTFGFQVAEQRPDKFKAIVAVEAASAGNIANAPKLKDIPVLQIFGDYVDQHPRWSHFKKVDMEYGNAIKAAGGSADWIDLPSIGIKGNSHMLMQDKNSAEIAEVIQQWLVGKGLVD